MRINGKRIEDFSADDMQTLIDNEVPEDMHLEYKEQLPDNSDSSKKEFLADVSAFANKFGGVIVFGVREKRDKNKQPTGLPAKVTGLPIENRDKEKQRLQAIVRAGLEPKLTGLSCHFVDVSDSSVLLLGIPRSFCAPHAVWYKHWGHFYQRTSTGKVRLDVHELRQAFLGSEHWEKATERFRHERIADVTSAELIPHVRPTRGLFMHILPLGTGRRNFDVRSLAERATMLPKGWPIGWVETYNLDGHLLLSSGEKPVSYIQSFRDGGIEFYVVASHKTYPNAVCAINGATIEDYVTHVLDRYLNNESDLVVEPPIAVYLSLTNVMNCHMRLDFGLFDYQGDDNPVFDRPDVLLPAIMIESQEAGAATVLEPALEMLWQAGGYSKNPNRRDRW